MNKYWFYIFCFILFVFSFFPVEIFAYSPLINGKMPVAKYKSMVSNVYFGEPSEYKASFVLPKGVQVGNISIAMMTTGQDLFNAELIVAGLPAGTPIINRSSWLSSSESLQYTISPSVVLTEDTPVTITLKNVINPPAPITDFTLIPRPGSFIGFEHINVMANNGESTLSINLEDGGKMEGTNYVRQVLRKREEPRNTSFVFTGKFETTNKYFGEKADHIFSFVLPKNMYIGRLNIGYNRLDADLSNASLEVIGLPNGTAEISSNPDYHCNKHFSYTLPETVLLKEDTKVTFRIYNVVNPTVTGFENNYFGISPNTFLSLDTNGRCDNGAIYYYNYNYLTDREHQENFSGNWRVQLVDKNPLVNPFTADNYYPDIKTEIKSPATNLLNQPSTVLVQPDKTINNNTLIKTENINKENTTEQSTKVDVRQIAIFTTTTTEPANYYKFIKTLKNGTSGEDVRQLQKYLNNNGFTITKTGVGSPGKENLYFGSLTKKALIKFQKANNLPATGFFGQMTIEVVNSKLF